MEEDASAVKCYPVVERILQTKPCSTS